MRLAIGLSATAALLAGGVALPATAAGSATIAGTVTDTHGKPVAAATMTLLRSDTPTGTYTQTGSTVTTTSKGAFSWSASDGYYKVTAAKRDCYAPNSYSSATGTTTPAVTSGVQQVPPSVTGLRLTLDCTNLLPVASLSVPALATTGSSVTLDASASHDPNGTIRSYEWDFGDGVTRTTSSATVTHVYSATATFTPRLRVVDDQGASDSATGGGIAVGGVPAQLTNLSAASGASSVTLSWSAPPANNSPITGYTVDISPPRPSQTTSNTTLTVNGLDTNTSYTFTVHATNGFGSGPSAKTQGVSAASSSKPSVLIGKAPVGYSNATSGAVEFSVSPASGTTVSSTTCSLDLAAATACTSPYRVSGLAGGAHTVVVTATDSAGNVGSASTEWVVDQTRPTAIQMTPSTTTSVARSVRVRWGGADADGVSSYDVRYRKASWNGGFGRQTSWQPLTAATAATLRGRAGTEYCFSSRARDYAGNTSGWTAQRCTALPLDDAALSASGTWATLTGKRFYDGRAVRSTARGASLRLAGAVAGPAALLVTRGKGFGSLVVHYGTKKVKTVSLAAVGTQDRVVIGLPQVPKSTTKTLITITVVSAKKPVIVDGLVLARV